jgi:hypothetical protein
MAEWMRNTVESTLGPAQVQVKTPTTTRTPTGGTTTTYVLGGVSFCNIAALSSEEREFAEQLGYHAEVTARVSLDLDVDPGFLVVVTNADVDELDGEWKVTRIDVGFPAVDRLLYLARVTP